MERWVVRREPVEAGTHIRGGNQVNKIAEMFGETRRTRAETEKIRVAAEKKQREKEGRTRLVMQRRKLYEQEGGGEGEIELELGSRKGARVESSSAEGEKITTE